MKYIDPITGTLLPSYNAPSSLDKRLLGDTFVGHDSIVPGAEPLNLGQIFFDQRNNKISQKSLDVLQSNTNSMPPIGGITPSMGLLGIGLSLNASYPARSLNVSDRLKYQGIFGAAQESATTLSDINCFSDPIYSSQKHEDLNFGSTFSEVRDQIIAQEIMVGHAQSSVGEIDYVGLYAPLQSVPSFNPALQLMENIQNDLTPILHDFIDDFRSDPSIGYVRYTETYSYDGFTKVNLDVSINIESFPNKKEIVFSTIYAENKDIHPEVLKFCEAGLLKDDSLSVIEEAIKSIYTRLRKLTGLTCDGEELINKCFTKKQPLLRLRPLTRLDKNEQNGFANIIKGLYSRYRTPFAHEARINTNVGIQDMEWVLSTVSMIHREIDSAIMQ